LVISFIFFGACTNIFNQNPEYTLNLKDIGKTGKLSNTENTYNIVKNKLGIYTILIDSEKINKILPNTKGLKLEATNTTFVFDATTLNKRNFFILNISDIENTLTKEEINHFVLKQQEIIIMQ
jgi:hypothetical protein